MKQNVGSSSILSIGLVVMVPLLVLSLMLTLGGHGEVVAAEGVRAEPGSRSPANSDTPGEDPAAGIVGRSIWADGTCTPTTLDLKGSYQYILGGLHSNGTIKISGNAASPSYISGPVEYAGGIDYMEDQVVFDYPPDNLPIQVQVRPLPMLFEIEDYAYDPTTGIYGAKAQVANSLGAYFYYPPVDGDAILLPIEGLHYTEDPQGFRFPPGFPGGTPLRMTIVTPYMIEFDADTILSPYIDGLLLFSTHGSRSCPSNITAQKLSGSRLSWQGLIYAPNGHIDIAVSDNSSLHGILSGWTVSFSGSQVTIIYDEAYDLPGFFVDDQARSEGDSGSGALMFTVAFFPASDLTTTVDYATADGTAKAGIDYQPISGTLEFAPGETAKTIEVEVIGDLLYEEDESFSVILENPVNQTIADGKGEGLIQNDDAPPALAIGDSAVLEGVIGHFVWSKSGQIGSD